MRPSPLGGGHRLGSWTLPFGNSCDVDLVSIRDGVMGLAFGMSDQPPPRLTTDERRERVQAAIAKFLRRARDPRRTVPPRPRRRPR